MVKVPLPLEREHKIKPDVPSEVQANGAAMTRGWATPGLVLQWPRHGHRNNTEENLFKKGQNATWKSEGKKCERKSCCLNFCFHFSTSKSTLLGNTLIFPKVESVSAMTAIGQWSPCYSLDPQAFSSHFLPCPVEEGSQSTSGYCSPRSAHRMVDTLQQEKWNLRINRRK